MIIVKTKNGDRLINDKAVTMVEHIRDKAVVNAHGDKGLYYHIEDVEGVIYTNDAQPTSWQDEGSALGRVVMVVILGDGSRNSIGGTAFHEVDHPGTKNINDLQAKIK